MAAWIYYVIVAIVAIVAIAMQPRPPKQKRPSLEDFAIPRANQGDAIPMVFGTVTITGPTVVWYGDLLVETETEDGVKTRKFYMGLHFILSHGPLDNFTGVLAGEREAWSGDLTTSDTFLIDNGSLFGGKRQAGGIYGDCDLMMGEATQTANAYLTATQGTPQPAYRGVVSVVANQVYIAANTTSVEPWAFKVKRILNGWADDDCWYPAKAEVPIFVAGGPTWGVKATYNITRVSTNVNQCEELGAFTFAKAIKITGLVEGDQVKITPTSGWAHANEVGTPPGVGYWWTAFNACQYDGDALATTMMFVYFDDVYTDEATALAASASGVTITIVADTTQLAIQLVDSFSTLDNTGTWQATVQHYGYLDPDPSGTMNPAHIIYQAITDPMGMGLPASMIDTASFEAAADTFYDEGLGLCLQWTQQEPIEDFIQAICDHAACILRVSPRTGKFQLKPLRYDYDPDTLTTYDEDDIIEMVSWERVGYGELVGEVTITYRDMDTNKDASVTQQNLAVIQAQSGVVSESISLQGIPYEALAQRVCMRELRARSVPLARCKIKVTRAMWESLPGDPFKASWAKLGLSAVVMRVTGISTGALDDGTVEVDAVEDVFGMPDSVYSESQASGWSDPVIVEPDEDAVRLEEDGTTIRRGQGNSIRIEE